MADVAIAHKDYDVRGGGELVAERLADTFDAPLFVGRRNSPNEPDNCEPREIAYDPLPDRVAEWAINRGGRCRRSPSPPRPGLATSLQIHETNL